MARVVAAADAKALELRTRAGFASRFGREASCYASAPGRANLIGEHTDYNDGLVLPFAIGRRTAVAAARRSDRRVRVASASAAGLVEFDLDRPQGDVRSQSHDRSESGDQPESRDQPETRDRSQSGARSENGEWPRWGDYVRGVVCECLASGEGGPGLDPGGFDAWIDSDLPVGAGLSSSAALEIATATIVETLAGRRLDPVDKARLCRRAEQIHAGVPCGIMDQMASALADEGDLLFLDCRDESFRAIGWPDDEARLVVVDSGLPHDLGEGEFARRVKQCREAASRLGLNSLRDATPADLVRLEGDALLHARARHVIEENARVLAAVAAIAARDWPRLGVLLDEGHASLRDLYEVSRPEMDRLVDELKKAGALGARMTGGGFGGCVVALFERGTVVAPDFPIRPRTRAAS